MEHALPTRISPPCGESGDVCGGVDEGLEKKVTLGVEIKCLFLRSGFRRSRFVGKPAEVLGWRAAN